MIKNLWGTLPEMEMTRTPYTVLLEQATLLRNMTNGLLIGKVKRRSVAPNPPFVLQQRGELKLLIVAPALDNYSYVVVTLIYPVATLYPVTVEYNNKDDKLITCHSEEELMPVLEAILSSERTRRIIANLLMQSRIDTFEEEEMTA